jgi:hypothetical protein
MTLNSTSKREYEKLRIERTKSHLIGLQVPVMSMVRPPPPPKILMTSGNHVRVGEWVEVDHCYRIGICSDDAMALLSLLLSMKICSNEHH